jgi:hypothetical protein
MWWVSLLGLVSSSIGSLLLVFFTRSPLIVTREGSGLVTWANQPLPEVRHRNKRTYRVNQIGFKAGTALLCAGLVVQFAAELMKH